MTAIVTRFSTMQRQVTKACLTAAAIWLASVAGAFAASPDVALHLTLSPAEVVAIMRSMDRQPISETPPDGFWDVQVKIKQALEANPDALRAEKQMWLDSNPK
jgi:hypothetical protein